MYEVTEKSLELFSLWRDWRIIELVLIYILCQFCLNCLVTHSHFSYHVGTKLKVRDIFIHITSKLFQYLDSQKFRFFSIAIPVCTGTQVIEKTLMPNYVLHIYMHDIQYRLLSFCLFLFWSHTSWVSGVTLGCLIRNYFWRCLGNQWDYKIKCHLATFQASNLSLYSPVTLIFGEGGWATHGSAQTLFMICSQKSLLAGLGTIWEAQDWTWVRLGSSVCKAKALARQRLCHRSAFQPTLYFLKI